MPLKILVVEDHAAFRHLICAELQRQPGFQTLEAADGVEAVRKAEELQPDLILLDLNLPRKNGREVLEEIKADDILKRIPVIVMTTSKAEQDIHRVYNLNANCYVTKPVDLDEFLNVVRSIEDFWLTIVTLPNE